MSEPYGRSFAEPSVDHAFAEPSVDHAIAEPSVDHAIAEPSVDHAIAEPSVDHAIATLTAGQHAVLGIRQLEGLGLSARAAQKRALSGRLYRIYAGVYGLVPRQLLTREGHWMAATLACGPGAVVSHRTAAVLHGLLQYDGTKLDVTTPGPNRRTSGPFVVHRSRTLRARDVTVVNNVPCTTVARTLFDLSEVVERRRLERAFDQAEILELFDLRAIEDQLERNRTRRGASLVRAVLEEHYIGSAPTESELEDAFLSLCRRAGLPRPEVQQWLLLPDGDPPIRADFLWREQRVVVETDGRRVHGSHQAAPRDARRDQRLTVHHWRPIRTGWRQITRRPAELEATLVALLHP